MSSAAHAAQVEPAAGTVAQEDAQASPGDIIVTATRRNESIQKVPLTIQAFTGATLTQLNVKNFNDLIKYTPNVTFGNNGPGAGAIFLRGLSTGFSGTQSSASIASFPNVALYLDDQSMQFPGRNADIYVADLERVEVLEGPQGTLFGGGAQAGAVRYITNKPKLDAFSGHFEGSAGGTRHGAANGSFNATINVPIVENKLAVRAVIYDDHRGGYIDNVFGTFTRGQFDQYANYLPNPTSANQANAGQYNNTTTAEKNYNPADYVGGRVSAKWQITDDWDVLVSQLYQKLDTENSFAQEPSSPDFTPLKKLQTVTFVPGYSKDEIWNTALTVNGKIGDLRAVYTGAYMVRHLDARQDYTNYSRAFGEYYQCVGSGTGIGTGAPFCYDPYSYWTDKTRNTHLTQEVRLSTPAEKRIRVIAGGFYERFKIYDNMDFNYKSTPVCTAELIANGGRCLGLVQTGPGTTANDPGPRGPKVGFGQDLQRGYDQYAGFGSVDFDLFPNLTFTAGTRYYHYKTFQTGSQFQTTAASCEAVLVCNFTNPVTGGSYPGNVNIDAQNYKKTYSGFKSRFSVNYKPTESMILFATFSQGFRPGGFNRSSALILPGANGVAQFLRPTSYRPDNLTNYEAGIKTDLFDRKVTLNVSGYYMQWKDVQIQFFNPNGGFGNTAYVTNGADFDIKGFEAQLSARPFPGISINAGFTYNDSKQVSSPCLISNNPGSSTLGQCITQRFRAGVATPVQSPFGDKGSELPFSPKVQANLRGRYDWEARSNLGFWVAGGVTYTGKTFSQPSTYPSGDIPNAQNYIVTGDITKPTTTLLRYRMKGYALLDAQIGIKGENWTASIFGDNLTDSNVSTFTSSAQFIKSEVVVRPTTYGLRLSYDF
ncbi:TonB-dependent receptor [Sphingomonas profundi]|uniref:TonB-dependent receptor n=1 Tax=Alterirhizorhabdus profundi TaxID=2681549 RepID=UPI001E585079|nr:TonB-dependent receptor [Sphingomonas profundi]